jgi:hypothetical protein
MRQPSKPRVPVVGEALFPATAGAQSRRCRTMMALSASVRISIGSRAIVFHHRESPLLSAAEGKFWKNFLASVDPQQAGFDADTGIAPR